MMRQFTWVLTYGIVLTLAIGCRSGQAQGEQGRVDVPAGPGSAQPHLSAADDGTIWMSWLEKVDSTKRALRYASFDGEAWSEAHTIVSDPDLFANWADIPKLETLPDGRLAAHFGVKSGLHRYATNLLFAQTRRSGEWQDAITLHDDGTATEHGFASAVPFDDGLIAVWLDGRETTLVEGQHDESDGGDMALYAASIDANNAIIQTTLLDDRVCDCCPTAAVRTESGSLFAYRDRGDDETRDISLLRFDGKTWSKSYPLHADGWTINGCPVNGPALAADGDRVVAGWFTAAGNEPKVKVAFSDDGGRTFGAPVIVDDTRPKGRVDVVLLADGAALVSWIGIENRQDALKVRRVSKQEGPGAASIIAVPQSPAFTGIPRMVRSGSDVYVAWVDGGHPDRTQILLARQSTSGLVEDE